MKKANLVVKSLSGAALVTALSVLSATPGAAERYVAYLTPLNAEKIGTSASGTANLEIADGKLTVTIDLVGLTPSLMHLQHSRIPRRQGCRMSDGQAGHEWRWLHRSHRDGACRRDDDAAVPRPPRHA